ncbi:MAG TPA: class I SAM-dependent methyltransferase [Candidatus Paceibacterota bacterium]|nr:class I SAM-dependent methyltransferase [Candidatus Paceibacterota bacterium]
MKKNLDLKLIKKNIKNNAYIQRQELISEFFKKNISSESKFLDIGCSDGCATLNYAKKAKIKKENIFGLDINDDYLKSAGEKFNVFKVDLEKDDLPFDNNFFDVIVIDQVMEHIKNIHHLIIEIDRILKAGGLLIISVPNLAAWHNRFLLLIGKQPLCINVFSDHCRGFCKNALKKFINNSTNIKKTISFKGAGFYPFWGIGSKILARIFPNSSVYLILIFQKNENSSNK